MLINKKNVFDKFQYISINIIFNRDRKFYFNLWKIIFNQFNIRFIINITYYLQFNKKFNYINQIIEIILRFLIFENSNIDWMTIFFVLQFRFNNNLNFVIDKLFDEIILKLSITRNYVDHCRFKKNYFKN